MHVSPNASHLITVGAHAAQVWDVWAKKKTTVPFAPALRGANNAALSPDGKFLALSGPATEGDGELVVVYRSDGESYKEWKRLSEVGEVWMMSLSAGGRLLATLALAESSPVRVWDVASGRDVTPEALMKFTEGEIRLSPGGRFLLAESENQTQLLDLSTGRPVPLSYDTTILSAAFSPDERYLGIGSEEGVVHVFETARPENEIARLQHDGRVTAIAFSDDGKYVATGSSDESATHPLRVWLLQPADLLAEAAARLKGEPVPPR
jgi:WD40 repeat protein